MELIINEFKTCEEMLNAVNAKIIVIEGKELMVFASGVIYRLNSNGKAFKLAKNVANAPTGYNTLNVKNKTFYRHRIMGMAFLNLDVNNKSQVMDHINGNRIDNRLENLRIVSYQQNSFNSRAKGYYYDKCASKYRSQITVNGKNINVGLFKTAMEANQAYIEAKKIYHVMPDPRPNQQLQIAAH